MGVRFPSPAPIFRVKDLQKQALGNGDSKALGIPLQGIIPIHCDRSVTGRHRVTTHPRVRHAPKPRDELSRHVRSFASVTSSSSAIIPLVNELVGASSRQLSRKYPDLWATENAAGKWLEKKPLDACKVIIRKWGVLVEYRPQGQRSWSKAIVRNGVEDQKAAIESALGVMSGSVVVR